MPQNLKSRFHIQQLFSGKRSIVLMEVTFLFIFNLIKHILKKMNEDINLDFDLIHYDIFIEKNRKQIKCQT